MLHFGDGWTSTPHSMALAASSVSSRSCARVLATRRTSARDARSSLTRAMATSSTYAPGGPIEGARVVVTGANRGIGLEFCRQLLAKGNVVEAACRAPSEELRALEGESDGALIVSALDVSDEGSIEAWAKGLKARGVERLDVVINNAGVVGSNGYEAWDLETTTQEEMVYVFKVNTCGPVLVTKALVKEGLLGAAAGGPSLVGNVTSKVGSVDDNGSGRGYSYRASKSALNNCNKSMSIDLADRDVHFALLHPGWVRTEMTEGRGLIDAAESAAGLIAVMEGTFGDCEQNWFDYKGDAIPW